MGGRVVRIGSQSEFHHPGNPDQDVVAALEDALERARSGEVTGLSMAFENFDHTSGCRRVGAISRGMVGRLFALATQITNQLDS